LTHSDISGIRAYFRSIVGTPTFVILQLVFLSVRGVLESDVNCSNFYCGCDLFVDCLNCSLYRDGIKLIILGSAYFTSCIVTLQLVALGVRGSGRK